MKTLIYIIILLFLTTLVSAENYANYNTAEIKLKLDSEVDLIKTGSNPRLMEAEAILNLVPLETKNQEILKREVYSEPQADVTIEDSKIIYKWKNIYDDKISYGVESEIKTKNTFLKLSSKISYPQSFESEYGKFTKEQNYININDDIKDLSDKLFEGETNLYQAVYKTAQWVEDNVKYDMNSLTEKIVQKSSWVLENKQGVCDEITNLFISLLRAKGIPSRFISGVVYSQKTQGFENHGWAEVYFENYGWIPFDITYSQYGWVDVTHIKLSEAKDSGTASIDYYWKSSDLNVNLNKLDIKAEIKDLKKNNIPLLTTAVEPFRGLVGPGSYVPLKITIENPTDFYIIPNVYLTKSPPLEEKNRKSLFLEPKSIKSLYFTVKVPKKLNENYIFKSEIEAETTFGDLASSKIEISSDYPVITKEQAEEVISEFMKKEAKQEFKDIEFDCTTKSAVYYEDEDIEVICRIKNNKKDTKKLDVCLTNCKEINLEELEERLIVFKAKAVKKIIAVAENKENIKYFTIDLDIIKIPNIAVKDINPLIINYNEEVDLRIEVESTIPAYDAIIYLGKQEILNTNLLLEPRQIDVKIKGKDLISNIKLKMIYKDKLGKEYEKTEEYLVTIKNRPWYTYLYGWLL